MKHSDEKWIEVMNQYKEGVQGDIYSGITMKEEQINFERVSLFQNKVSVMLPTTFTDMPLEIAKIKYPSEQRPQIIKTNPQGDINFAFSLLNDSLQQQTVIYVRDMLYQSLKTLQPANQFFEKKELEADETLLGWFDFKSFGFDDRLYTLMFCRPVSGKLFHGIFNCRLKAAEHWKSVVLQVLESIQEER